MSSRTLLVLGASGFLGPHLVRLAAPHWRVVAVARRPEIGPHPGAAAHERVAADLGDFEALGQLLARHAPSALVNAAALSRVEACEREPALAARLNAELPAELARQAVRRGLRLVHVSTDLVFGAVAARGARYGEDDPVSPVHAYGRTKAAGEAGVLRADPGALVVRLPLLYGDSLGRGLGASDQLLAALARGERPALFTDEWRTPLDVADAAQALLELLETAHAGRLHVAGPERLTRHELALAVLGARGLEASEAQARLRAATRAELGLAATRPADVALDATRARALLATPLRAVAAALSRTLP